MRLSAKPIVNWGNVNQYAFGNQWTIRAGDPNTLYFQILDVDQAIQGNGPGFGVVFSGITPVGTVAGLRYLLGIGGSNQPYGIKVTFQSIDNSKVVTIIAVQADANDSSIWKINIPANQPISGGNVQFQLTEGSSVRSFSVTNMLSVEQLNNGSC